MASATTNQYLRDAVMTASQEQLQMMLYDGAIRFATRGRDGLAANDFEKAFENLSRAQKIMLEMHDGLNFDVDAQLCGRMSAIYMFIYRRLIDGCTQRDLSAIDDALKILKYERDTWQMLIDKLTTERGRETGSLTGAAHPLPESGSLSLEG